MTIEEVIDCIIRAGYVVTKKARVESDKVNRFSGCFRAKRRRACHCSDSIRSLFYLFQKWTFQCL